MKYIRTKNGVYEVIKNELGDLIKIDGGFILLEDVKDKVIDQADTMDKLCDKFVIVFNNKEIEPRQFAILKTAIDYLKQCDNKYEPKLKGAIWTDKGLIYVSEMNGTGELKLI